MIFIGGNLENAGPMGQKCILYILLGFNDIKVLLKYFYILIFCPGRAFERYIENASQTVISDMATENIFTAPNFWRLYRFERTAGIT